MGKWLAAISFVIIGMLQLFGSARATESIVMNDYVNSCVLGDFAEGCEKLIKPINYPNRCDLWDEISVFCFVGGNCSDTFITSKKSDFEKAYGVECSTDWYENCENPKTVRKCEKVIEPKYYLEKCEAWDELIVCYTENKCLDKFVKDKKKAFREKYFIECADDWYQWKENCNKPTEARKCEKGVGENSYNDKCVTWDELKECYTQGQCSESFIKEKQNYFYGQNNAACPDVKIDGGDYGTNGLRISTVCGTRNVSCSSKLSTMTCEVWHAIRKCFDSAPCLNDEVDSIKHRVLSKKGITCGSSSLRTSVGFIFLAAIFLAWSNSIWDGNYKRAATNNYS